MQIARKIVITRKPHRCFACLRKFEKGTEMESQTNVYEGEIYTIYSCNTCYTLMKEFEKFFLDTEERQFPEGCVCEGYSDKIRTPEELLMRLREEKYDNTNRRLEERR